MTAPVTRAVFDTNIVVSGLFWKGPPHRCLLAVEAGLVSLVISDPIVSELRDKLTGKFDVPLAEADAIIGRLNVRAERAPVTGRSGWVMQDPDDDKFIDAALASGTTTIVSGDRHLLALGSVEGIEILTAKKFLDRLVALSGPAEYGDD